MTKSILWYTVLIGITAAYLVVISGVRAAKRHDIGHHSWRMIMGSIMVGIWLVAYVSKQLVFGRETFGGTREEYWLLYMPVFSVHMVLAAITIGLGAYNLYTGTVRLWKGTGVGAMKTGVSRHRLMGKILVWTFSGTMATAYLVYLMLFVWFKPA